MRCPDRVWEELQIFLVLQCWTASPLLSLFNPKESCQKCDEMLPCSIAAKDCVKCPLAIKHAQYLSECSVETLIWCFDCSSACSNQCQKLSTLVQCNFISPLYCLTPIITIYASNSWMRVNATDAYMREGRRRTCLAAVKGQQLWVVHSKLCSPLAILCLAFHLSRVRTRCAIKWRT